VILCLQRGAKQLLDDCSCWCCSLHALLERRDHALPAWVNTSLQQSEPVPWPKRAYVYRLGLPWLKGSVSVSEACLYFRAVCVFSDLLWMFRKTKFKSFLSSRSLNSLSSRRTVECPKIRVKIFEFTSPKILIFSKCLTRNITVIHHFVSSRELLWIFKKVKSKSSNSRSSNSISSRSFNSFFWTVYSNLIGGHCDTYKVSGVFTASCPTCASNSTRCRGFSAFSMWQWCPSIGI
jgi:hypothetical protein